MKTWGKQKGSGFGDPLCAFPCVQRESELGPLPLSCALVGWGSLCSKGAWGQGHFAMSLPTQQDGERLVGPDPQLTGLGFAPRAGESGKVAELHAESQHGYPGPLGKGTWSLRRGQSRNLGWFPGPGPCRGKWV